jgi:imidazolonepropionase-like amidohydrolase
LRRVTKRPNYVVPDGLMRNSERVVGEMQQAGVKILAGTDTPAPFVYPGFALHEELALLVKSGLTPMQALQAATSNAAEFMGKSATQGTIEKGKVADLLLLDANPLADIHNTSRIIAVVVRGKLLDRASLDAQLASAEKFAQTH